MGMFTNDIVYGGKRLDEWCEEVGGGLPTSVVLWDCGLVAENVETEVGRADKVELVITPLAMEAKGKSTTPDAVKVGTFASAICEKVKQKADGDLPAVVRFEKVESRKWGTDALVMSFVAPFQGDKPTNLGADEVRINAITPEDIPFD